MHPEKFPIDAALVRRLVAAQFPQWADLPVEPVAFGGWDNRTFHLGERMTVRLPSAAAYVSAGGEGAALAAAARAAPAASDSRPPGHGRPGRGLSLALVRLPLARRRDRDASSASPTCANSRPTLAEFLVALQRIDAAGGPPPGPHNFYRGGPLTVYDGETRQALAALDGRIDTGAAREVWEAALSATWRGAPVWVHGDVAAGNLLVQRRRAQRRHRLRDVGRRRPRLRSGDRLDLPRGESREAFRAALPLDDATWARGRGWTLWKALITLAALPAPTRLRQQSLAACSTKSSPTTGSPSARRQAVD